MLDSFALLNAMRGIRDEYVTDTANALGYSAESPKTHHINRKLWSTLLVAAIIVSLFTGVAYAVNLFGLQALLIKNSPPAENQNEGYVSLTQPQDVPEEMADPIRQKIDNSTEAWAEWDVWRKSNGIFQPTIFQWPEGCVDDAYLDNGDGTWTVIFYAPITTRYDEDGNLLGYYDGFREIERRTATQAEYEQNAAYKEAVLYGVGGLDYDFNYQVFSQEMADKLESIAASHGLKLRHQRTVMYQNYGDFTQYSAREEITAKVNEICARGKSLFRTEPPGYEKFYYFDEGTFAINFYTSDELAAGTSCYLYNSPYSTLSSGFEIFDQVQDIDSFTERIHTTPDGTELTVLQKGINMYAYVYLENSFVTLNIKQSEELSDTEIDAILDMVDFSAIG